MKKIMMGLIILSLAVSLSACGSKKEQQSGQDTALAKDAKELLQKVWDSYEEEEKFAVAGGDMSEENSSMEGPGTYSITDTEALDSTLGFPPESVEQIDGAASLMHMMNANTFTCGAFHLKDEKDADALVSALRDHIQQRNWMCGFPDKLVIAKVGDYVVSFFGENQIVDTFRKKLCQVYKTAEIAAEESIA